jgi:hypothetical protein
MLNRLVWKFQQAEMALTDQAHARVFDGIKGESNDEIWGIANILNNNAKEFRDRLKRRGGGGVRGRENVMWLDGAGNPIDDCSREVEEAAWAKIKAPHSSLTTSTVSATVGTAMPLASGSFTENDAEESQGSTQPLLSCPPSPSSPPSNDSLDPGDIIESDDAMQLLANTPCQHRFTAMCLALGRSELEVAREILSLENDRNALQQWNHLLNA